MKMKRIAEMENPHSVCDWEYHHEEEMNQNFLPPGLGDDLHLQIGTHHNEP